jgi:uncharacterized protein
MGFTEDIQQGYTFKGDTILLGLAMHDAKALQGMPITLPLATMNRHGLIAGATGTGKTKTLQRLSEQLSNASVPVVLVDIKGDLSGIAAAGTTNPKIEERCALLQTTFQGQAFPVELFSLSNEKGTRLKATVSEFGPVLLSKILGLNDTQEGVVSMIFKYCDDKQLPVLDLKDFIKVLQYLTNEGKEEIKQLYGSISPTTTGTILRKVIEIQQQGGDLFFGEKSFEVEDLMRMNDQGQGYINIIRTTDLQDRPKLFSTFMLQMLAELYGSLPEAGDIDRPKLVMFIDEAHLIFSEANDVLLQQIENIVKLIRSKGVGVFFCTQNPTDIPQSVLSQLGLKVQHALRAFTAKDRQDIKKVAQNYPESANYDVEELITQLGIGEAFVTGLNENGIPTPLVHCMMAPPSSRMGILTDSEMDSLINKSKLTAKYNVEMDSQSAYEILGAKLAQAAGEKEEEEEEKPKTNAKEDKSTFEKVMESSAAKQVLRTGAGILTRTLLGALGLGGRSKKSSWF